MEMFLSAERKRISDKMSEAPITFGRARSNGVKVLVGRNGDLQPTGSLQSIFDEQPRRTHSLTVFVSQILSEEIAHPAESMFTLRSFNVNIRNALESNLADSAIQEHM